MLSALDTSSLSFFTTSTFLSSTTKSISKLPFTSIPRLYKPESLILVIWPTLASTSYLFLSTNPLIVLTLLS